MKIAIAFFGIPRCSDAAFPTIQEKLMAHFPKDSEYKCFYHFYQQAEVINPRSGENGTLDQSNYQPFMNFEGLLENPAETLKSLPFEELKKFGDSWNDNFNSLRNLMLQLNSLKKVTKLLETYNPDCVLFARPDLVYHDSIPAVIYKITQDNPSAVFIPNWQWGKGLNDTFGVCGRDAYRSYGNRLDECINYCQEKNEPLHSERLLKYALLKVNKTILHLDAKASRVRIGGVLAKENYKSHSSLFGPITNPNKRFFFLTKINTKLKMHFAKKKYSL